jgi:hypothetical protein
VGHILHAGGLSRQYAVKDGLLSLIAIEDYPSLSRDQPMPVYHGIGMFSGTTLFRSFGASIVTASSSVASLEVFASDSPKNIVLVNKNPGASATAAITLNGDTTGTATPWVQNSAFSGPSSSSAIPIKGGVLTVEVGPYSVVTLVLTP